MKNMSLLFFIAISSAIAFATPDGTPAGGGTLTVQGDSTGTPLPVGSSGKDSIFLVRNAYGTTAVTTTAYVQLVASTSGVVNHLIIFDSSGSSMYLAFGAAASEVNQVIIPPGGMQAGIPLKIPSGTRISIKAVDTNASTGQILMTGLK